MVQNNFERFHLYIYIHKGENKLPQGFEVIAKILNFCNVLL